MTAGALLLAAGLSLVAEAAASDCVHARQSGAETAEAVCRAELAAAEAAGRDAAAVRALFQLAIIARTRGRLQDAEEWHERIQRAPGFAADWHAQYSLAREQGIVAHVRGRTAGALTLFRGALALAMQHADAERMARSYNDLGNAYRRIDAAREALDAYTRSLDMKRARDDRQQGSTLHNIADLLVELGDYARAEDYYRQALVQHQQNHDLHHLAHVSESMANLAARRGRYTPAVAMLEDAFAGYGRLQAVPDQVRVATLRAAVAMADGEPAAARDWLDRAGELVSPGLSLPARWYIVRGDLLSAGGESEAALMMLAAVEDESARWPAEQRIERLRQLAELSQALGRPEAALTYHWRLHEESLALARSRHDRELARERVLFEVAEQQREIERLRAGSELKTLALREQRARTASVGLAGVLGVGLVVLGAAGVQRRRTRRERRRRQALEETLRGYRAAAQALRTSQARLRQLLDFGDDALLAVDANDCLVFANSAAHRLLAPDTVSAGRPVTELFPGETWARAQPGGPSVTAVTRGGLRLALSVERLNLEEELLVVSLRQPGQEGGATQELVPLINRHFARVQAFGAVLQAALHKGGVSDELHRRWQAMDKEIHGLAEQLQPVQDDARRDFRRHLVELMRTSLETWERSTGGTRVDLAEASGIWRVTVDEGRLRTRALDRYLKLGKLPRNPRWREVLRTAYFVLGECPVEDGHRLREQVMLVQQQAIRLGLG